MARRAKAIHWIPAIFVVGFALIIAANGVLIWLATASFSGLDEEHAYESGLAYNRTLKDAAAIARLQWDAELETLREMDARVLILRLADSDGQPLTGLKIIGKMVRPTLANLDRDLSFEEVAPGNYHSLPLRDLASGQWEARLIALGTVPQWQMTRRMVLE